MIKLRCVGNYANDARNLRFAVGDVFDAEEPMAQYLMVDAPGCFVEHKAVEAPPKDKAVKRAPEDKGL